MSNNSIYKKALKASWDLAWHHKLLWIFGLFAAFLGQMGLMDLLTKVGLVTTDYTDFPLWIVGLDVSAIQSFFGVFTFSLEGWLLLGWLALIFIGFGGFLLFVAVSSQGALIDSAAQFIETEDLPDVDTAWHTGTSHFWRLLGFQIIKKGVLFLLTVLVGYSAVNAVVNPSITSNSLFIVFLISSILLGMIVSFLAIYAAGYVVVEEYGFLKAIKSAFDLFVRHWLVSIEVGVTILALSLLLALVTIASVYLLFLPTLMIWLVAITVFSQTLYYIGIIISSLLFILFIAFVGSVFTVFTTSAWTYLFVRMHRDGIMSHIMRLIGFSK